MHCETTDFLVNPCKIAFLRFILEGYDGIATLSTIDAPTGHVLVRYPPENQQILFSLLESLKGSLGYSSKY